MIYFKKQNYFIYISTYNVILKYSEKILVVFVIH